MDCADMIGNHSALISSIKVQILVGTFLPFPPPPLGPVAGLLAETFLDAGAQRFLVVQSVEPLQDAALMGLVLVAARVNLGDQSVEVGISAQGTSGDQLLPAGRALLVSEERQKRFEANNTEATSKEHAFGHLQLFT